MKTILRLKGVAVKFGTTTILAVLFLSFGLTASPTGLRTLNRQLRIDILWDGDSHSENYYQVQRGSSSEGPFDLLPEVANFPIYSDFLGEGGKTYYYRVRVARREGEALYPASEWSAPAAGTSRHFDRVALLEEMQEASTRYVTIGSHPKSGLTCEWITTRSSYPGTPLRIRKLERKIGASGATGMGITNYIVAVERGWMTRIEGARAVLHALRFLDRKAERFHGAFSHWINNENGDAVSFSKFDDGADVAETALLLQGILIVREFFDADTSVETELRDVANRIWGEVDWNHFRKDGENVLYWHWSPKYGWKMNMQVRGFIELEMLYLLAIASPTHPVPVSCFYDGWRWQHFGTERNYFETRLELGRGMGGCTFWYLYSYLGLDPKQMFYRGSSYHAHFSKLCRVQIAYMRSKAQKFKGYDRLWGLTAAPGPDGYTAFKPGPLDNGTISPLMPLSAYLYAPVESQKAMEVLYLEYGDKLWQEFGFLHAFNLTRDWRYHRFLGIDHTTVAPMLENYRTGLLWRYFMNAPEIREALSRIKTDPRWGNENKPANSRSSQIR